MKDMLRRDGVLFRRGLIPALVLTLLLGLASALAAYSVTQSARENAAPIRVGLVDEEGSLISRMAVNLVSSQSFISSLVKMEPTKREEALKGLAQGRYGAVIILPEGYIDQVRYGNPGQGQIILSRGAAASGDLVASLAHFGELLLAAGQNGIFAGEALIAEKGLSPEIHNAYLDRANTVLMDQAFSLYHEGILKEIAPYNGTGISTAAYYAAVWISFFLLLCGLFFPALYTKDVKKSMLTRLYSLSLGPGHFLCGKVLYPLLFRLPLLLLLLAVLNPHLPLQLNAPSLLCAGLALLIASCLMSFAGVALGQKKGWQGLLIGLVTIGLFLCGGLIPRSMLPAYVTEIGRFTPFGAVLSGLKPLWGGAADPLALLMGLLFTLLAGFWAYHYLRQVPQKGEDA